MEIGPIERAYTDIKEMRVRGAGRLGRAAAEALRDYASVCNAHSAEEFHRSLVGAGERLKSARPTAVSLPNSVNYVLAAVRKAVEKNGGLEEARSSVISAANDFIRLSLEAVERIAEIGGKRVSDGDVLLTHCNSEAQCRVIMKAHEMGKKIKVFVAETRPWFQGRITATRLAKHGIDTTLIVDSAVRLIMDEVDKVVIGADAITANGAVVNKVGTAQVALAAKENRARLFVAAESYKLSHQTFLGELIEIEERSALEVVPKAWLEANPLVKVRNPAFDITPPEYIDMIITERGAFPPQGIILLMKELYR